MIGSGFRIGRIGGVEVRATASVFVLAALLGVLLGLGWFPYEAPSYPAWADALGGFLTAVAFIGSILAHELSHARAARKQGIPVQDITLWFLGGMTKMQGEPATPWGEVRISGSGPLTSFLIAIGAFAITLVLHFLGLSPIVVAGFLWIGAMNGILAVMNALPGSPLDGGRLLHAYLWHRSGDRLGAAVKASKAGQWLGFAFAGIGVAWFAFYGDFNGIWLAAIGWFMVVGARAEGTQAQLRRAYRGLSVHDVMEPGPVIVPGWMRIDQFVHEYLLSHHHNAFPVEGWDGQPLGLITMEGVRSVPAHARSTARVQDVVIPKQAVPVVHPDERLDLVADKLGASGVAYAVVIDHDGHLVGVLTPADLARAWERAKYIDPVGQ